MALYLISKGQALQFNYLLEKGAVVLHANETFSVNFDLVIYNMTMKKYIYPCASLPFFNSINATFYFPYLERLKV